MSAVFSVRLKRNMHDIETKIGSPQLLKHQVGSHDLRHGTVCFEILGLDIPLLKLIFTYSFYSRPAKNSFFQNAHLCVYKS